VIWQTEVAVATSLAAMAPHLIIHFNQNQKSLQIIKNKINT